MNLLIQFKVNKTELVRLKNINASNKNGFETLAVNNINYHPSKEHSLKYVYPVCPNFSLVSNYVIISHAIDVHAIRLPTAHDYFIHLNNDDKTESKELNNSS